MKTQLKIRTEYSFKHAYGPIKKVVDRLGELDCQSAAITDRNSTFGHIAWNKYCKNAGIKPLFGCEFAFINDLTIREKRQKLFYLPVIAKTNSGLKEIYAAMEEATSNFYYVPRLPFSKLQDFSQDVLILSGISGLGEGSYLDPRVIREGGPATRTAILDGNIVAVSDNYMIRPEDKSVYSIIAGRNQNDRPSPMHILNEWDLRNEIDIEDSAFTLADRLAEECNAEIQTATNIKYQSNRSLKDLCLSGAQDRQLELNETYHQRLDYELNLIHEKGYDDYFFVITDMIQYAKKNMIVGPARGSSCGSLACYLLGITDIDPIPHNLIFERFIDVTRYDLPDIDIDFQDTKREMVFEYIREKYGTENVARLGTVSRYKPKSAIGQAAKALSIPDWETKEIKDSMLKRSSGDSRAGYAVLDTFQELEIGKAFIEKYPAMKIAGDLEGHASHTGMHAAGVIITNEPLINYVSKDVRTNTVQVDKWDAELINLMKIDALGLKALTILSDCLDMIGWTYSQLLKHPLNDDAAFEVLRKFQFCGIFQFEGQALQTLARRVAIDRFDDIACLTALARPGPFASGASNDWVQRRAGKQQATYVHSSMERYTKETYGIIVYQEQVMNCVREIGLLSWEDTSTLRKAMSKSFGIEYFDKYWQRFKEGAMSQGIKEEHALQMWNSVNKMGSWAFNKSHAVAYGMLSYFCCILKAHYPVEFALATMRNTQDVDSVKRYLRELDRAGYGFKTCDAMNSEATWSYKDGSFLGGLTNIKGIGNIKAKRILLAPAGQRPFMIPHPIVTPYDNIFEGRERFADLIANPHKYNIIHRKRSDLIDIHDDFEGQVVFIAKLLHRNERSLNEAMFLVQRNNVRVPNDKWLNVLLEDDTSTVHGVISRFKFPSMGLKLLNEHHTGDWFIWGGLARNGRRIYIDKFRFLGGAVPTERAPLTRSIDA
jgi:DNA-directed DNA polymerase III PolC